MNIRNVCTIGLFAFSFVAAAQQNPPAAQPSGSQQSSSQPGAAATTNEHKGGRQDAASSSRNRTEGAQAKLSPSDNTFVMHAAQGGMAEVQLAQIAQKQGQSEQVKQLAQRIEQDHTNANNELKSLAEQRDITLPTSIDAKQQATIDRLSKLNGDAFDRAYARQMVSDHRKDIKEFERASNNAFDSSLKAFATKTLPTLREHLSMAEEAQRGGASGSSKPSTKSNDTSKAPATDTSKSPNK